MESIREQLKKYEGFQTVYQTLVERVMSDVEVKQFLTEHQHDLTQDMIAVSYGKLYEFVTEKEKVQRHGKSQNPGYVPRLVLTKDFIDVAYEPTEERLRLEEQQKIATLIQTFEMPQASANLRLNKSSVETSQGRKEALRYLLEFSKYYDGKPTATLKGAYLYGSYGVGKTYLACALAGELAHRGHVCYVANFPSLVVELKSSISSNTVGEKIDVVKQAPVLILDDIGGETLSDWVRDDILMTILDYRMRYQLPTFFTSNLNFDLLETHLLGTKIEDERKAKRLMERIRALCTEIKVTGANQRQQQKYSKT